MNRDSFYSRMVSWLKILLPLVALAMLSTVFLLSRGRETVGELPFSRLELQERTRAEVITAPRFTGVSANGHLLSFVAEQAKPDAERDHLALAKDLRARIDLESGNEISFDAGSALLDSNREIADLTGGVVVQSSTGYTINSDSLLTRMAEVGAETRGPVTGQGPAGQIEAGKMILSSDPDTGDVHLLFTHGVKLLYQP